MELEVSAAISSQWMVGHAFRCQQPWSEASPDLRQRRRALDRLTMSWLQQQSSRWHACCEVYGDEEWRQEEDAPVMRTWKAWPSDLSGSGRRELMGVNAPQRSKGGGVLNRTPSDR